MTITSPATVLELYRRMFRIRRFEEQAAILYRAGHIPGFVHLAIGQEATAVGACFALRDDDVITSTHRGHAHALARGLTPVEMYAELMGREAGVCRGRGGSMHIADPSRGIFGANGIVGAGIPIAGGAAQAARFNGKGGVAVAFLGDGALSTGAFHEAANLASLWELPLVLFCENNRFSEFSHFDDQHPVQVEDRARGLGLRFRRIDGNDVVAVAEAMTTILAQVRDGGRPYLVEALTLRVRGHYEGDPQHYRSPANPSEPEPRDPLIVARERLAAADVPDSDIAAVEAAIEREIDEAIADAELSPQPPASELSLAVTRPRPSAPASVMEITDSAATGETWKYFEAVRAALHAELENDDKVFVAGIDIGASGNVFGITRGLKDQWPSRVLDTPISETAIMGLGVGAAMAGYKPVLELMYFDFLGVCLDQIMNQAAKLPYMTGGQAQMALTLRTQIGAGRSSGAQHSQSLEAMLCHIPGLTVVMPSTPSDAYGLLRAAIADPNPVVVVEHRLLYGSKGPTCSPDHLVPIGQAAIRSRGTDLTIVSWSRMATVCLEAVNHLATEGISAELIDLRTIAPLNMTPILESVATTSRLLIVHEAHHDFGPGAEIAARMANEGLHLLDAPVVRVAPPHVPAPYSPSLEQAWLPDLTRILDEARRLVRF